jgi:hypothetical protein
MSFRLGFICVALTLTPLLSVPAGAKDDPCSQFSWDVHEERALFAAPGHALASSTAAPAAPSLNSGQLYSLALHPQAEVRFAAPPGRQRPGAAKFAGLASLTVDKPGIYRIALDQPAWVDVLSGTAAINSSDFQGQPGCNAPHKIVAFAMPAHTRLLLQFSGAEAEHLAISVTRAPAPAAH